MGRSSIEDTGRRNDGKFRVCFQWALHVDLNGVRVCPVLLDRARGNERYRRCVAAG